MAERSGGAALAVIRASATLGLVGLLLFGCGSSPPTGDSWAADSSTGDDASADARVEDTRVDAFDPDVRVPACQPAAADGAGCDDGDPCTLDDRCQAGQCLGNKRDCRDDDPCSIDVCDPFVGCVNTVLPDAPCDDSDDCTGPDRCKDGLCAGPQVADGTPCAGEDACIAASACHQGLCEVQDVLDCPEPTIPCRLSACNPNVGCETSVAPDGSQCGGGSTCRADGTCDDGQCVAAPLPNGTPCGTASPCHIPPVCVDGECVPEALEAPGTPCVGSDACALTATCDATGACVPTSWVDCDDGSPCTTDGCSASAGCLYAPQVDGSPCDGPCGLVGTCHDGACDGPDPCDDVGGPCEQWTCGVDGGCVAAGPRPDGSPCGTVCAPAQCAAGQCGAPELVECFDGNACVERQCVLPFGCVTVGTKSAFCNADDDPCTLLDRCQQGSCGAAAGCDDLEPCSQDACSAGGCVHTWTEDAGCDTEAVCDDGLDNDIDGRIDCLDRRCERSGTACTTSALVGGLIDVDSVGLGTRVAPGVPTFVRADGQLTLAGDWTASPTSERRVDASLCCFELPSDAGDLWLVFREVTTFPAYGDGCPGTTDHLVTRRVSIESPYSGAEDFPLYTLYQGGLPLSDTPCEVPTWRTMKLSGLAIGAAPLNRVRLRFQASFLGVPFAGGAWTVSELAIVGPETCDDGVDDNGDSRVDCDDPLCFAACSASP
ncbi:MAG: hypothetical protein IV100_15640 [Myxococcales bacterium]|nr:hypothetical protein [Myxococcales bacterium]